MLKIDNKFKNDIAIVTVGYNRINSMKRLFGSLLRAKYPHSVPLVISIDCSGDQELYDYVQNFHWPYGEKFVNIQTNRLGLRNHILQCGDLTKYFRGVIILEDDIFVSEYFYPYVEAAVDYYYDDDRIAAISLYRNEFGGLAMLPTISVQDGADGFLKQSIASWGQCWTDRMWASFRNWYDNEDRENFESIDMPDQVKAWSKAWSKYYIAYEIRKNKFCLFPSVSHTTCFSEVGEHGTFTSSIGQVTLLSGPKKYHFVPFDEMTKYDTYGINTSIYKWLDMDKTQLCVDLLGFRKNLHNCRFILTTLQLPYVCIKSYALSLRPIELNIKYDLEGDDIFIYDTTKPVSKKTDTRLPLSLAYYHLRLFNIKLLRRYIVDYYKHAIKRKISFFK